MYHCAPTPPHVTTRHHTLPTAPHLIILSYVLRHHTPPLTPTTSLDLGQTQKANALQKTAELQQRRLVQIMRHRHRDGALGVDGVRSSADSGTHIYQDRAAVKDATETRRMRKARERRSKLATVAFAQNRYGHNPFHHNEVRGAPSARTTREQCANNARARL